MPRTLSAKALGALRACFAVEEGATWRLVPILGRSISSPSAGHCSGGCRRLHEAVPLNPTVSAVCCTRGPGLTSAATAVGLAAATAARSAHLATAAAGRWRTVSAAASAAAARQHQQARGFARFLQFQPRPGGGWGGGGGGWLSDSDAVIKGLISLNIAGFLLWRVAPGTVRARLSCRTVPPVPCTSQRPARRTHGLRMGCVHELHICALLELPKTRLSPSSCRSRHIGARRGLRCVRPLTPTPSPAARRCMITCARVPLPFPLLQMLTHGAVSIEGLRAGRLWTVLTAAFSHQDLWHLGGNMLGLYFFGRDVGRLFGGKRVCGASGHGRQLPAACG